MRFVYTADLHGDIAGYRQLLEFTARHNANTVIVGGDLLPHGISISCAIQVQRDFILQSLRVLLEEFHVTYPQTAIYLLAGNDDWAAAIEMLSLLESDGLAYPLHNRVFSLTDDLWLAGYACVPITPFSIKDYERFDDGDQSSYSFAMAYTSVDGQPIKTSLTALLRRPSIAEELAALTQHSDPSRTIYVCHSPPYNTALDMMRHKHVGSRALRAFIERHQPFMTLHGHIHESPQISGRYADLLGTTWCVNPGHERTRFSAIVVDTDDIAGTLWHTLYGPIP